MITIAIVEDEEIHAETLKKHLLRYAEERKAVFDIRTFDNAVSFLENYRADYDLVFMDIKMPYMNGMDAAHKLRELDKAVLLVFVTSITQFAVKGYEVEALDYIVKPVGYYEFALKLARAMDKLDKKENAEIVVPTDTGLTKLRAADVKYVEVRGHHVVFHTISGDYRQYQTIRAVEEKLAGQSFARCNNCFLVNLRFVTGVEDYVAHVGGDELQISHPRKKDFVKQLNAVLDGRKYD